MISIDDRIERVKSEVLNNTTLISIGLFGINKHGKSSLIKSFESVLAGEYSNKLCVEVGSNSVESKTMNWETYNLPRTSICVSDNRGFGKLTEEVYNQIIRQNSGYYKSGDEVSFADRSIFSKISEIFQSKQAKPIDCPIFVWNGVSVENVYDAVYPLMTFIKSKTKHQFLLVVTHGDKIDPKKSSQWASFVNSDPDNVFIVRNYTSENEWEEACAINPAEVKKNYLQFLKILKRSIEIAKKINQ